MRQGRVLVAEHDGMHWLRLEGDVRLTLCNTIDGYIEDMLQSSSFAGVLIDLRQAEGLDSTTLGLVAKIAIGCRERLGQKPTVLLQDAGVMRILESVGFDSIFDIRESLPDREQALAELLCVEGTEQDVQARVLAAHRLLMELNEKNRDSFRDLVQMLEGG